MAGSAPPTMESMLSGVPSGFDSGNAFVKQITAASCREMSWRHFSNVVVRTVSLSACVFQFRTFIACGSSKS